MSTNKSKDGVEVVTFQRRRGKKGFGQVIKIQKKEEESADKDPQEFDFRKARHDVFKFGVSGLDTNSKLDAKVALAVKLGARVSFTNILLFTTFECNILICSLGNLVKLFPFTNNKQFFLFLIFR